MREYRAHRSRRSGVTLDLFLCLGGSYMIRVDPTRKLALLAAGSPSVLASQRKGALQHHPDQLEGV
jgi:hypothetical protein